MIAYVVIECGVLNLDSLNSVIEATGVSEAILEQLNADFANVEEGIEILTKWQEAHERRLEALNEIEAKGYVTVERIIREDSPGGLDEDSRTTKSYWVGIDSSSPTGAVWAGYSEIQTRRDFPNLRFWHPTITLSGDTMLRSTQWPEDVSRGGFFDWDYYHSDPIKRPAH